MIRNVQKTHDRLNHPPAPKTHWLIFLLFFLSRCLFKWVTGHDNFELFGDSYRYDIFSDQLLSGNFNLDGFAFIIAPLYPYFLAGMKLLFGAYWQTAAVALQFAVVSWSGVWLYRLALLVFQRVGEKPHALIDGFRLRFAEGDEPAVESGARSFHPLMDLLAQRVAPLFGLVAHTRDFLADDPVGRRDRVLDVTEF